MKAPHEALHVVALLLVAAAGAARAQDSLLVLRRDWTPSTCSLANVTCRDHPDSFSIDGLFLANWTTGEPRTACTGKPPLALPELTAAGLLLEDVACAFQNYDPGTTSLEPVWRYHWEQFGACTSAGAAADYFGLGLDLDQRFPLPQDIVSGTSGAQLTTAIQAAFNARPYVACDPADGLLRNIQICFDPAGGTAQDCPWTTDPACGGPLRVPRTGRGAGFPSCQAYYPPSPVSALLAASSPPTQLGNATSPSPAPAAASPPAVAVEPPAEPPVAAAQPPSPAASPPQSPPPSPLPVPAPAPAPQPSPAPAPPSPAPPSPSPPSPSPAPPPPDPSPPPSPSPLPPPPSPAEQAPPELVPLETSGSGGSGGSGGGTSTGAKVGALVGGIVGGMILGAAVIGVSYRAYTRCAAGSSKASAGSTSGPLLEAGSASDASRQSLPLYSSRLPAVPE